MHANNYTTDAVQTLNQRFLIILIWTNSVIYPSNENKHHKAKILIVATSFQTKFEMNHSKNICKNLSFSYT
jgi:hypothetical protein